MFVTVIILKLVILIKVVIIFKVDQLISSFKHFCFNIIILCYVNVYLSVGHSVYRAFTMYKIKHTKMLKTCETIINTHSFEDIETVSLHYNYNF